MNTLPHKAGSPGTTKAADPGADSPLTITPMSYLGVSLFSRIWKTLASRK